MRYRGPNPLSVIILCEEDVCMSLWFLGGHNDVGVVKTQHGNVSHEGHVEHDQELQHGEFSDPSVWLCIKTDTVSVL